MSTSDAKHEYERTRQPLKRIAVRTIRAALDSVPVLGCPTVFLKADRAVQDAVYTLNAMGYRPALIVEFVDHEDFNEMLLLDVLASAVTRNLTYLLKGLK
jgi:hypothetical protein